MRIRKCLAPVVVFCFLLTSFAAAATTTVDFWWGESAETDNMLALVDQFEAIHPEIKINLVDKGYMGGGAGLDQVKAAIVAGVPPDIVWMDAVNILGQALGEDMYIPLGDVIDHGFLESIPLLPGPQKYVTYQGRFLGLQFRTDARGFYFNQDFFEAAGLDSSKGPEDIAELDQYAAKLTKFSADNSVERLGFSVRGDNMGVYGWMWVFGGHPFDRETMRPTLTGNPQHVKTLEWIADYAQRYGADAKSGSNNFMAGKVAMFVQSTTWLNIFPDRAPDLRWNVGHIPYPPEGRKTTLSGGFGPVIPRGAKHPQAAGEFIKFLAQKDTQIEWYKRTRGIPSRADALKELIDSQVIVDPRERTMVEQLPNGEVYAPLDGTLTPELEKNTQLMREQKITPEQVLENTQRAIEPAYRELFGDR